MHWRPPARPQLQFWSNGGSTYGRSAWSVLFGLGLVAATAACGAIETVTGEDGTSSAAGELRCSIPEERISGSGGARGGIPALTDPATVPEGASGPSWLGPRTRVVGIAVGDTAIAVPMNILWYHEVVNFDLERRPITVSHCPLTGSTLVFDRTPLDGEHFVVSGLVYMSNLIMATRETGKSLFPQMEGAFRCGPESGERLNPVPYLQTTWSHWRELHPETSVLSARTGHDRNYPDYPYGRYRNPDNSKTAFAVPELDPRRPPKEMVLGIPSPDRAKVGDHERRGTAVPFGELEEEGRRAAVGIDESGRRYVLFWDSIAPAARAFHPTVAEGPGAGRRLSFEVRDGAFRDRETGSAWGMDGVADRGELAGARLEHAEEPYLAFWFAWALFQPDTEIWDASEESQGG